MFPTNNQVPWTAPQPIIPLGITSTQHLASIQVVHREPPIDAVPCVPCGEIPLNVELHLAGCPRCQSLINAGRFQRSPRESKFAR
jgi:hypothetical protein